MSNYEKKYKELVGKIDKAYLYAQTDSTKAVLEEIRPELKENEDERIRKGIIRNLEYLMDRAEGFVKDELKERIAWLEKQGEQKQETNYPKFDFDDILAIQCCMEAAKKVTEDKELYEKLKSLHSRLLDAYWIEKQSGKPQGKTALEAINEEKVDNANKIESKFKDGDVLNSPSHRLIWIYKDKEHYHACVNMNYVTENVATEGLIVIPSDTCLATKEQCVQLEKAMTDAGYTFDFERKELKKVEDEIEIPYGAKDSELIEESYYIPKGFHAEIDGDKVVIKKGEKPTAWSEENEAKLKEIISDLKVLKDTVSGELGKLHYQKEIIWLKSLKKKIHLEAE